MSLVARLLDKFQRDKVAGTIGADYKLEVHIFVTGYDPRKSPNQPGTGGNRVRACVCVRA